MLVKHLFKSLLRTCLLILFFVHLSFPSIGQLLEPMQPEQDACNAIDLCGNIFTTPYSYQGIGTKIDLNNTPCGGIESNSVWLKVKVKVNGTIAFKINPFDIKDDYDFAVIKNDTNCANINNSQVIRCNFNNNLTGSNPNGVVGLSESSNEPFIQSGAFGHSFAQAINAVAGEVYYIMINNFGHDNITSAGFTVDFSTSTATFENTSIPKLGDIISACDYSKNLKISLSNYALCGSISPDGSDFIISDKAQTSTFPALATGLNCSQANGYTKTINLQLANSLPDGEYVVQVKKGTDGNTILGLCNGEMLTTNPPLTFSVKHDSLKLVALDSPACKTLKLVFNQTIDCSSIQSDASQFYITGPSEVKISDAIPSSTCIQNGTTGITLLLTESIAMDGNYVLHFRKEMPLYGTCGNILDYDIATPFTIKSFNGLLNTMMDTTVCRLGDSIQLNTANTAMSPITGFNYVWTLNNTDIQKKQLSPWINIPFTQNHFLVETVDFNGCILRDTLNIAVESYKESLTPIEASICLNDSLILEASNNAIQYQWFTDNKLNQLVTKNLSSNNAAITQFKPDSIRNFTYYLLMRSRKQCLDTLTSQINVKPLPPLTVAFKDTTINYGTDIRLGALGASIYEWTPMKWLNNVTTNTPIAHPLTNIIYTVKGSIENGCYTTDSIRIKIYYEDFAFFPTGFTPNRDGKNDIFRPTFFGKINDFKLMVFNRWGQIVFQSNNPSNGWDGTTNGKIAESGTYIWECHYQPEGEKSYDKKGTIVLIR